MKYKEKTKDKIYLRMNLQSKTKFNTLSPDEGVTHFPSHGVHLEALSVP